jgi:hypothetical protein
MLLSHITLTTGHLSVHRLDTLDAAAVAICRTLLPTGGGPVPGFPAFRVEIHGPLFTIYRGREPLVSCGMGRGRDATWASLCALDEQFRAMLGASQPIVPPPAGPWLAVAILPSLALLANSDAAWLGDFERCLAAAILLPQ